MSDTLSTTDRYRVRLEQDHDQDGPDHDGQGYVFRVDYRHRWTAEEVHRDSGDSAPTFDIAGALDYFGTDWQMVERYLRVWHDVVSFDYADLERSGPTYVFVVTRAQAVSWGLNPDDHDRSYTPEGESRADIVKRAATGTLETWRQWAEGDIWSYVIESRHDWTDAAGATITTWDLVDSLGGMYGREYAEGEARDALASHDPATTCRHCNRTIVKDADGRWIDPEATGDDSLWRETCDAHDTVTAEHEPA